MGRWTLELAQFDVAPFAGSGMLLKGDLSFCYFGKIRKNFVGEFAAGDHSLPFFAAHLTLKGLYSIQIEGEMTVVLDEPDLVPFADGVWFADA